ncbi:MAG: hypothetical protein ACYCUV_00930 [Phycisphaerae bacterium]|jgi:hypothetical protein
MKNEHQIEEQEKDHQATSGQSGSHVVGTGIGAVTGGVIGGVATGAAIGTAAGPIGTVAGATAGAVIGAVAGGFVGKEVATEVDPDIEHDFWRSSYSSRPYFREDMPYDQLGPAYQYGWESRMLYNNKTFEESEPILARGWPAHRGHSHLHWDQAKHAARDSWERISNRKAQAAKEQTEVLIA